MKKWSNKGSAIPLVLSLALLLILATSSLNFWLQRDGQLKSFAITNNKAFYLAEAGIEQVIWNLQEDCYWFEANIKTIICDNSYFIVDIIEIDLTESDVDYLKAHISSLGCWGKSRERIDVELGITYAANDSSTVEIISWQRSYPN